MAVAKGSDAGWSRDRDEGFEFRPELTLWGAPTRLGAMRDYTTPSIG